MAGLQRSGKNSRVTVGGTPVNKITWEATWKGDDLDTVTFEDEGLETGLIGVEVVEYSMGGDWDAGANNLDSPPGLYPSSDLDTVELFENVSDNVGWEFPVSRVLSSKNGAKVRETVKFESSLKSNGAFTAPTGDS